MQVEIEDRLVERMKNVLLEISAVEGLKELPITSETNFQLEQWLSKKEAVIQVKKTLRAMDTNELIYYRAFINSLLEREIGKMEGIG